jgi:hypothetical protein
LDDPEIWWARRSFSLVVSSATVDPLGLAISDVIANQIDINLASSIQA